MKNYGPITLVNAPFQEGGIYCNGIYQYSGGDNWYLVITPQLEKLNFNSLSISAKFKVGERKKMPVFVGGRSYRWLAFYLNPDGKVSLKYTGNNYVDCEVSYRLNTWHEAVITYDGSVARLYLDGNPGCSVRAALDFGNDERITLSDFSNGATFKGILSDLKIYNTVIRPTGR